MYSSVETRNQRRLNESPSEKEGKSYAEYDMATTQCLNESPSEKEGKSVGSASRSLIVCASMKVPPKRKGKATRK